MDKRERDLRRLHFTQEPKRKRGQALKDRPRAKETVEKISNVWRIVRPLYARGALAGEIAELTDLTHKQVKNSIKKGKRPEWNRREPFSINGQNNRIKRALQFKKTRSKALPENEIKNIKFARELLANGLVTDDLSYWERMVSVYKGQGRSLPSEFSERLRLEFFLQAVSKARSGDNTLLMLYITFGERIDVLWFDNSLAKEEDFISIALDNSLPHRQDKWGLYRLGEDGYRWYQPVSFGENGGMIFDSLSSAQERSKARERNGA